MEPMNQVYDTYADFSGRGYADSTRTIGVAAAGSDQARSSGPRCEYPGSGCVRKLYSRDRDLFCDTHCQRGSSPLMEWGIVRGNDPFLYGEKVKAYFRKGARPLRGETEYPNDRVGYGKLCVAESLLEN